MQARVLKYGMVFILPLLFLVGLWQRGLWSYSPLIFAFGIIPLLEIFFAPQERNVESTEREMRLADKRYDFMLYLVVPILYTMIILYLFALKQINLDGYEITGLTLSLGVMLGGMGINVAHELGHRNTLFEQTLSKMLLLPSAYMHFFVEHNRGHHKNVSTHEDPASARFNESLYHFWMRSLVYSYISAWNIEKKRLQRLGISPWSIKNEIIRFQLIQVSFWLVIGFTFGWLVMATYTSAAIIGFLMLETVNYIEHYGLQRNKVSDHRYEKVQPIHSWNSNHVMGRVMLFELSRHSDHHYEPTKKYQILDHHDLSPQMPTGYPGMMLLSLIPPLWFAVMNPKVKTSSRTTVLNS